MAEAERSRKLVARGRTRLWAGATTPEEARAYLQARLNVYSKVMFWSFVALLVFLSLAYRFSLKGPWHQPRYVEVVFGGSAILLAVMAFLWRAVLYRKPLSVDWLYRIDLVYAITIGGAFGASAAVQYDLKPAAYTSLIFGAYNVFTRALFVPSSARRTAVVSSASFLPIVLGGIYLGLTTPQDFPPGAYIIGGCTISVIAIVIAANGSDIIYTLRREAAQAMQLGSYTLDRKIGSGGMGTVYRARHALLRRADRDQADPPRSRGREQPRALRARGPGDEPADAPEHGRGLRLRPHARGQLLLRDGVPRRHRPRAARHPLRGAVGGARGPHPRAGVRRAAAKRTTPA